MASMVSGGCLIHESSLEASLLFSKVVVDSGCELQGVLALPECRIGENVRLKSVLLDNGCHVDGGYCAASLQSKTGLGFSFTGHSLGAQKMDKLGVNPENAAKMEKTFHFSKRILVAARKSGIETHGSIDDYPIAVVYWRGELEEVVESASRWIRAWMVQNGHQESSISANIVATFDDIQKKLELFFVPRHQLRSRSPELSGTIGGLEVLGEVVFSSEEEGQRLEFGGVDYHTVERILEAIRFD